MTISRAVQIDNMDEFGACLNEGSDHLTRIRRVANLIVIVALPKPDGRTCSKVKCWNHLHSYKAPFVDGIAPFSCSTRIARRKHCATALKEASIR